MADPLWINGSGGTPAYDAAELRRGDAALLQYDGRALGARQGIRPGGGLTVSLASTTITVAKGVGVVDGILSATQGPYRVALPADETHTLTAAHATNPRKDRVILRVYDHDEDASGLRLARSEYLVGTPAASPTPPNVPDDAFELALIDIPSVASGNPAVVTNRRLYTVATGGILPVRDAIDEGAVPGYEGQVIDRLDLDVLRRYSGSAWEKVADPALFKAWSTYTPTITAATTNPTMGGGTTRRAQYQALGRMVQGHIYIQLGSGWAAGNGAYTVDLAPGLPVGTNFGRLNGTVKFYDSSTGARYRGILEAAAGDTHGAILLDLGSTSGFTIIQDHNTPVTPASGDYWVADYWYLLD